jgi:hypothetical protein
VIVESPYAGEVEENVAYLKECLLDSLRKNEAPFASHIIYTQVLNDKIPMEREWGIEAGFAWANKVKKVVFYMDRGVSRGMLKAMEFHARNDREIEYRYIKK